MKTILVPTDFSHTAANSMHYSAALCKELNTEMLLLNVMHVPVMDVNVAPMAMNDLMEIQKEEVDIKLDKMVQKLIKEYDINVKYKSKYGLGSDVILKESNEGDISMVVMGTHGSSNVFDILMGSVSSAVAKKCEIPVLILNKEAKHSAIRNVAFAYDYKEEIIKSIQFLHGLNASNNSKVHLLSVEPDKEEGEYMEEVIVDENNIKEVSIWSDSVSHGIIKYVSNENIDVISIKRKHRNIFEELFHKSTTKQLIKDSKAPILVI